MQMKSADTSQSYNLLHTDTFIIMVLVNILLSMEIAGMSELNLTHSNGNKVKLTTPDTLSGDKTFKLPNRREFWTIFAKLMDRVHSHLQTG